MPKDSPLRAHNVTATWQRQSTTLPKSKDSSPANTEHLGNFISKPIGTITRGTTNTNRLRKADRWMLQNPLVLKALKYSQHPLAIDLGYGAGHHTTCEWANRLRRVSRQVEVVGLEISPDRLIPPTAGVRFELGGFEIANYKPNLVRAFNVLRQYHIDQVSQAWQMVCSKIQPDGVFLEGTCDELGRRCAWVTLTNTGPKFLTLSWDPLYTETPSLVAQRLPKVILHKNVPGTKVHHLINTLDRAWAHSSVFSIYGLRYRWNKAFEFASTKLPLQYKRYRSRDCTVTVPWCWLES